MYFGESSGGSLKSHFTPDHCFNNHLNHPRGELTHEELREIRQKQRDPVSHFTEEEEKENGFPKTMPL